MEFLGARVRLNPRPLQTREHVLEVAMLGHCPGRVRFERLQQLHATLAEIRQVGFGARLDYHLAQGTFLYHLPIPLHSLAEFEDIFPDARSGEAAYRSRIAGSTTWLAKAVDDFFANGGEKLWVVQIPEEEGIQGFLPMRNAPLHDIDNLFGISTVLVLNNVGLVSFPDLERIQIPPNLADIPRVRLANPKPQFVPCSQDLSDDHRERRYPDEQVSNPAPESFVKLMQRMLTLIHINRSDIQCLFTMPLSYSNDLDSPQIDSASIGELQHARGESGAHLLRQVQLLFPYMRSEQYSLFSPVGIIAGALAHSAQHRGIWRSLAWQTLGTDGKPYPAVSQVQSVALREDPGLGILHYKQGRVLLDDERIIVPALHREDYVGQASEWSQSPRAVQSLRALRSAEVVRFLGYIIRQLQRLGESMVFNVDYRDPRPRIILEKFFTRLYDLGALRGSRADRAFSIVQRDAQDGTIVMDIAIAPAFPIDKISLTFFNRDGSWLTEASYG